MLLIPCFGDYKRNSILTPVLTLAPDYNCHDVTPRSQNATVLLETRRQFRPLIPFSLLQLSFAHSRAIAPITTCP